MSRSNKTQNGDVYRRVEYRQPERMNGKGQPDIFYRRGRSLGGGGEGRNKRLSYQEKSKQVQDWGGVKDGGLGEKDELRRDDKRLKKPGPCQPGPITRSKSPTKVVLPRYPEVGKM